MATLSTQVVSLTGLAPTYGAASAGGDKVIPDDRTFLHVKNGSASSVTVTVTATSADHGLATSNLTVSVPASGERMIGPLYASTFAGASDGLVAVGYSATATVTVAALRI